MEANTLGRRHLLLATPGLLLACRSAERHGPTPATSPPSPYGSPPLAAPPPRCAITASNIEGPFYKPGAPERDRLATGPGLRVSGRILDAQCRPIAGVELDLWHADASGAYDNAGYGFRGRLRAGTDGTYHFDTIVPGRYLNGARYRPAHIHVKVRAPGFPVLTTQLYFPGDPYNEGDPFIVESLIMPVRRVAADQQAATFDFSLRPA